MPCFSTIGNWSEARFKAKVTHYSGRDALVTRPASSTDNAVALFDGTDGKTLKNSAVLYDGAFYPESDSAVDLGKDGTAFGALYVDNIDLNGQGRIDLDLDADTSIRASADDVISFEVGAADRLHISAAAVYPNSVGGVDLGTTSAELGDVYLADAKNIQFGNSQNMTIGYSTDYSSPLIDTKTASVYLLSSTETAYKPELIIQNDNDGDAGGFLSFKKTRGWGGSSTRTPNSGDYFGGVAWVEGTGDATTYAEINVQATSVTDDSESARMDFWVVDNGYGSSWNQVTEVTDPTIFSLGGKQISFGAGKHIAASDVIITETHTGVDSVAHKVTGMKIPANAIITRVIAVVKSATSNLGTHKVNVQMSTDSSTSADATIANNTELIGAATTSANTNSTDVAAGGTVEDINMADDAKEVHVCDTLIRNGGADQYVYVCNAVNNGTTAASDGVLTVIIEYYGID